MPPSLIATWLVRVTPRNFVEVLPALMSFGMVKRRHLLPLLFLPLGFGDRWVATSKTTFIIVLLVLIHMP